MSVGLLAAFVLASNLAAGSSLPVKARRYDDVSKIRAFHIVVNNVTVAELRHAIDKIVDNHFNVVILGLFNGVDFRSLSLSKDRREKALSVEQFKGVVTYARLKGLIVIPELKFLSKQQFLFGGSFPEFMRNAATYDPERRALYSNVVFPLLDEIIELIGPQAIHIGHDEVAGFDRRSREKWLAQGQEILPASLFLKDVKFIHDFLASRNVETWMWGDMLLDSKQFSYYYRRSGGVHGGSGGYGKPLLSALPKSVVVCDWHYFGDQEDFPSLVVFQNEGFRVLGATWKDEVTTRNFSRYAAEHGAGGMIATSWYHVQKKEWDVVERIMKTSGEVFLTDFPDEK